MSYEIDYSGMPDDQKEIKAIKDCMEWLGKEQFAKVVEILIRDEGRSSRNLVRVGLMMQGIQGYPAEAMMNRYWVVPKAEVGNVDAYLRAIVKIQLGIV